MLKKALIAVGLALTVGLASPARAIPIVPTNLDTLPGFTLGSLVAGPLVGNLESDAGDDWGDISNSVYKYVDGSGKKVFTYVHTVTPNIPGVAKFALDFYGTPIAGKGFLNAGPVAGYSFSDAKTAGDLTPADSFDIDYTKLGGGSVKIEWFTSFPGTNNGWSSANPNGETIRFFFQSYSGPSKNLTNYTVDANNAARNAAHFAAGESFAPSPEPSVVLLMGSALLSFRLLRRRK